MALLGLALPARALVVDGDPEQALRDPGPGSPFGHVAKIGGTSGVYLGDGWVITASHVGIGPIALGEGTFPPVEGSWSPLGGAGATRPDLGLFRVDPAPKLPPLSIARRAPEKGEPLLLVACGHGRGDPIEWSGRAGFHWTPPNVRRWGRNVVALTGLVIPAGSLSTRAFATVFDPGQPFEAQAALGDSGGGAFVLRGGRWRLAGIFITVATHAGQPPETAVAGNLSHLADLAAYRDEIAARISAAGTPAPRAPAPPGGGAEG